MGDISIRVLLGLLKLLLLLGERENDGVGGRELSGKVIEERLTVDKSNGGEAEGASILEVISELEIGVLDVVNEGFEGVEIPLLGAISSLYRTREAVVVAETELVVNSDDLVHFAANGKLTESGERIHP